MAMPLEHEIEYPTSDGQPMAETTTHRIVMSDVIQGLERRYTAAPDVWVGGNLFFCYRKGDPAAAVAPDVLLAKGVRKWNRDNYLLWEETTPALVFEVTSRSTRREDTRKKKDLYERLGIEEFVLFDPFGEYLKPRLQAYRLQEGSYQPVPLKEDGSLDLRTVDVTLRPEGDRLRMIDTQTGKPLLWNDELEPALVKAREQAAAAEARARALEEELARLRGKAGSS